MANRVIGPEDRVDHPEIQGSYVEEHVPNEDRALPSSRNTVLVMSILAALLAILAITLAFPGGLEGIGFAMALLALVIGAIAIWMAYGDARTGAVTPTVATLTAGLIALIIGLDMAEVDDRLEEGALPASATVAPDDNDIPAEIADPTPSNPAGNTPAAND